MIKRKIITNLMKKEETFKVMALGEALNTPILLIGPPGVAKTAAVIDFAKSAVGGMNTTDLFLLETDEGTRSNAIKGNVDIEALTTKNTYSIDAPITTSKVVVINEVDKASASLRNSLLGVMNERILFNGSKQTKCIWTNFIATCNEIPDDEKDSPFWDRFLVTHEVGRLSRNEMLKYYKKGGKEFKQEHEVTLPEPSDIDAITLDEDKLQKILDKTHDKLSDRSLSFLPIFVKNVMCVWGFSQNKALIKTAELLVDKNTAKELASILVAPEIRAIYDIIDAIGSCMSNSEYNVQYDRLDAAFKVAENANLIGPDDAEDMKARVTAEEATLPFLKTDDEEKILNS
jgi:MoxR-like ATPase